MYAYCRQNALLSVATGITGVGHLGKELKMADGFGVKLGTATEDGLLQANCILSIRASKGLLRGGVNILILVWRVKGW